MKNINNKIENNIKSFEKTNTNRSENIISGVNELSFSQTRLGSEIVWFSTLQTASYLDLSVQAVLNMTSNGKLPYYKLGRRNRYKKSDLDMILEANRKGPLYGN